MESLGRKIYAVWHKFLIPEKSLYALAD